jgi:L-threonylcarbamoyladenylate synthase
MRVFHAESLSEREFDLILSVLRSGGVIAFPTDTAYGLGADPFNEPAVSEIFNIKGRSDNKPILLLVDSLEMAERIAVPNPLFHRLATAFWPGPLTFVLPARENVPPAVTAGTGTIGLRWPAAVFATELIRRFNSPLTATSANRSGEPACTTAAEVRVQLGSALGALIDGGDLPARGGSTILEVTGAVPRLLREGPISFATLETFLGGNIGRATS